jgi:hypothetical protein
MVEHARSTHHRLRHLTLGVFIAFPVISLIASTHDAATVVGGHMPFTGRAYARTTTARYSSGITHKP